MIFLSEYWKAFCASLGMAETECRKKYTNENQQTARIVIKMQNYTHNWS